MSFKAKERFDWKKHKKNKQKRKEALRKRAEKPIVNSSSSIWKPEAEIKEWRPKSGTHWFDIVPYYAGRFDPGIPDPVDEGDWVHCMNVFFHSRIGPEERRVPCLAKNWGKRCPICEYRRKLINDDADPELIDALGTPKNPTTCYNVVVYDTEEEEAKGVQVFAISAWYMEKELKKLARIQTRPGRKGGGHETFINYADEEEGKTISFTKEGEGMKQEYGGYAFHDRDYELDKSILEDAWVLDECIYIPSYDEVKEILFGKDYEEDEGEEAIEVSSSDEEELDSEGEEEEAPAKPSGSRKPRRGLRGGRGRGKKKKEEPEKEEEASDEEENEGSDEECPYGGTFGKDFDNLMDDDDELVCDECEAETWTACEKAHNEMKKKEKPKRGRGRRRSRKK